MSNRIPEMKQEDIPYCFWHPEVPSQDTLRQLLKAHPTLFMRYKIGRACAAGGYVELYKELDLLPDAAIAEEARDNLPASQGIYDLVMGGKSLYRVMDDYNLCLFDEPEAGVCLNGDTCVRSTLDKRQPVHHEFSLLHLISPKIGALRSTGNGWKRGQLQTTRLLHSTLPCHDIYPRLTKTSSFSWPLSPEILTVTCD